MNARITRLVVISDLHIGPQLPAAAEACWPHQTTVLQWAIHAIDAQLHPNVVAITGDLINEGTTPEAEDYLGIIAGLTGNLNMPLLVLPGNHDLPALPESGRWGPWPQRLDLGHVTLLAFNDIYNADETTSRPEQALAWLTDQQRMGSLPIALQHAPVLPAIDDAYPYNLTNCRQIHKIYRSCGIRLSISGHLHAGLGPTVIDGVTYLIAPALYKPPFPIVVIDISEGDFQIAIWSIDTNGILEQMALPIHPIE